MEIEEEIVDFPEFPDPADQETPEETQKYLETRKRNFVLVVNNPTEEQIEELKNYTYSFIILALEKAPTTGTIHIQGYIEFMDAKSSAQIMKKIRCWARPARGTAKHNIIYCSKGEQSKDEWKSLKNKGINYGKNVNIILKEGTPKKQGLQKDVKQAREEIYETIKKTGSMAKVMDMNPSASDITCAEKLLRYKSKCRDTNFSPCIYYIWGDSGSGKSVLAQQILSRFGFDFNNPESCHIKNLPKWWDGYDGQEAALIDELRSTMFDYEEFLSLIGSLPVLVQNKGGSRQFLGQLIVITSSKPPEEIWPLAAEDPYQIYRRLNSLSTIHIVSAYENPTPTLIATTPNGTKCYDGVRSTLYHKLRAEPITNPKKCNEYCTTYVDICKFWNFVPIELIKDRSNPRYRLEIPHNQNQKHKNNFDVLKNTPKITPVFDFLD